MSSSKMSTATAIMAIVATSSFLPSETQAFQPSSTARSLTRNNNNNHRNNNNISSRSIGINARGIKTKLNMADDNGGTLSEVEKLRAAAAKAREEYERLSKEMGKEIGTSPSATSSTATLAPPKSLSPTEIQTLAKSIDFESGDAASQSTALDSLVSSGQFSLWKSAVRRTTSSGGNNAMMSLLQPFPVSLPNLESRTNGQITPESLNIGGQSDVKFEDFRDLTVAVVLGSSLLAVLSLAFLPPNLGASLSYLLALIPIAFIGVGSTAPGLIAGAIQMGRGGKEEGEALRERICRHEAGHFLCGYLCGLPVKGYEVNGDTGVACVEFHTGGNADSKGELSNDDIAALAVVAMSGSVAEIMAYGKASGGENDLLELQNCFRRSEEFIGAAKQQDLTRWGALTSYNLIRTNLMRYEGLVEAFKEKRSLAECVAIIEGSTC
mmetsp:Transcript_18090/g.37075  ORF Transcript_18090/g.37075 Transcript_18090/m.37075 type:complete len:438 (+) Transcript_18090:185-1498(+)